MDYDIYWFYKIENKFPVPKYIKQFQKWPADNCPPISQDPKTLCDIILTSKNLGMDDLSLRVLTLSFSSFEVKKNNYGKKLEI
jgi:hypothetical protein